MLERLAGLAIATASARFCEVDFQNIRQENVLQEYPERDFMRISILLTLRAKIL